MNEQPDEPLEVSHTKLWVELPLEIYIYFFRKVFAGDRGIKQKLSLKFYQALYAECLRQGIKGEWDPDNYKKIDSIISRLNFDPNKYYSITPWSLRSTHSQKRNPATV